MVSGERLRITLTGGAPWGFRLQGGGNFPLEVAKIRKRSSAAESGLKEGDHVVSINGYPLSGRSHQSAMDIVEMASNTLDFEIIRSGSQASKPLDPQRMSRGPVVTQEAGSTKVSSAHSSFSTHNGNVRTDVKTAQYVMNIPGGSGTLVTKTVSQKSSSQFPTLGGALSPVPDGGHVSRSPRRSPVMWSPPSKSASPASAKSPAAARSPLMWQPPSVSENQPYLRSTEPPRQQSPQVWQHHSLSPAPPGSRSRSSSAGNLTQGKENADPAHIMMSEQAKWEARHKHELETANVATNYYGSLKAAYKAPKMSDPNYPMFEIPKPEWKPAPKIVEPLPENKKPEPPPVAPKPQMSDFHPTEAPVAGTDRHYPGMIRPPQQPNVAPPPPPPPMPPAPAPKNIPMFKPRKLVTHAEDEEEHHHRPDHLPVFGPRVMFAYDEDSGMAMSPDRSDQVSDISSIARKKLYSDSTFYDDANHRFPTIDEQMSMCKRIAESLTSVANKKARGARMFANRKRKANKWVHEHCLEYGVCECSSAGDVADLDELDSELFYDEGGSKPLFTFRIPKIAGQVTEGERMSLSKQEFERLRLMAPKTDHNAVSPNQCFNIAADLHRGGKNKGAKLFQKRQARVEKYVIDETNVNRAPPAPTKLEKIIQTPPIGKSPWNAAAGGSVPFPPSQTYATMPLPRHNLTTEQSPKLIEGHNFNTKARGWGSGPGHQQHSYYRESMDIHQNVAESSESHTETPHQTTSSYQTWTEQQTSSSVTDPQGTSKFGDYNRRVKAWPGSGEPTETHAIRSYSEQTNYNSLPRGFGGHQRPQFEAKSQYGYCDL